MFNSEDNIHIRLLINEVCPRDGLQNESVYVNTQDKISLINKLSRCGFAKIEVTSFTSPKAIPALRDAEEVMKSIDRSPTTRYTALVPNLRGAERALSCMLDEANLVMSVSESHNVANLRMTRSESVRQLRQTINLFQNKNIPLNISLSTVFGCPFEGDVSPHEVIRLIKAFSDYSISGITLCDTTGMAYPSQVYKLCKTVLERFPELMLTLHFHDTRGLALANTLAALEAGVVSFDSAAGGLGGCPFAPGASGNASTEDTVHMLELMGYQTGVDLDSLISVAESLPQLIARPVNSSIVQAGKRTRRYHTPE
ncbi:hydroxymethylglutaryl-CoA lyase [Pantoea stewartii]|uniref:Hydroxymethylglutaryl-CoA lyase n=1 Tax=Pantoea stewartii TaxID=66269 RepID=A0AB34VFW2_9GAMM|nr:hydroxymethylglutaryl-CoA lyase [Pantoea stewartii]KTS73514.1 hydroxymethylglutaryl-CoA lyase [Pantoea stewartii]KTS96686.1 hydroxymethylglutaryl-CoA lyase [Pantoea stewartii]KTT06177.1 hydroxymethylglutaryl-CoA lyase [Pantoea stewartii]